MRIPLALLLLTGLCFAQDAKKPEDTGLVGLKGGDVYTVTKGVFKNTDILIKDGKIERIDRNITFPKGTVIHDVSGKRVLPGFVVIQARGLGTGFSGSGTIADNLDPFSQNIKLALASGITSAFLEYGGGGGLFGGRPSASTGTNAVVKMTYGTLDGMVVKEPVSINMGSWISGTPSQRYGIRENFKKARAFIEKEKDYEERKKTGKLKPKEQPPRASGAVGNYALLLKGERVARISASRVHDIRTALTLINDYGFKAILDGVDEGWIIPDEIGRAHAWCVVTPRSRMEKDEDRNGPSGSSIEQAKILTKAGVKIGIISLNPAVSTNGLAGRDLMNLPLEAAYGIRGGLDEETALKAITIHPAEMMGVAHRVGSIETGKDADLIVLDGDPFHYATFVEYTFVNGKLFYEKSRERYFNHIRRR